jgi:hypothetical protein
MSTAMEKLDKKVMKMAKGVFKLPVQTSHARIRASLGVVKTKGKLVCRLLKELNKYVRVFGERTNKWDRTVLEYVESLNVDEGSNMVNVEELTKMIERKCLDEDIKGYLKMDAWKDEYRVVLNREVYSQYDSRSVYLLKYFANAAYYKERYQDKCKFCDYVVCSRQHIVDECKEFEIEGCELVKSLMERGCYKGNKLSEALDWFYFNPPEDRKTRKLVFKDVLDFMTLIHVRTADEILDDEYKDVE